MLQQFVAAFDDLFVWRVDKNKNKKEKINVRYVFGPKQRVLYDIVNQAKNITLPAISIEHRNVQRDPNRVMNKDQHMTRHHVNSKNISKIPQPIPVNLDIDVSFVANYKQDIDQIANNIIPWFNPYLIISWKIPDSYGMDFDDELRSEVSWSGSIDYENPVDIGAQDKYRIVGNTSFTIKGWVIPPIETTVAPIYVVRNDFRVVGTGDDFYGYNSYGELSGVDNTTSEIISISSYPEFTNCFINGKPYDQLRIYDISDQTFTFFGKRFGFNNSWYLSSNQIVNGLEFSEIDTIKYPTISAYKIPESFITTVNDNVATITLSSGYISLSGGDYTFITSNETGWSSACRFLVDNYNLVYNEYIVVYDNDNIVYHW